MLFSRKEAILADKLDRLLAGEKLKLPAGLLEEKVWQVLQNQQLQEKRREKELDNIRSLMSDISHQLKTPLSALILHLDLAGDNALTSEERELSFEESKKQADKIKWLTESLIKLSRLETGIIKVKGINANIYETLNNALSSFHVLAKSKELFLDVKIPNEHIIYHDPLWLKEVFANILDNALKYTNVGGVEITLEKGVIYTRIDIKDTGIGIDEKDYPKIFQRFYRVRETEETNVNGMGLGLYIAREILRQHSGNITVKSERGVGSTFSVFLQNRKGNVKGS